MTKFKVGDKVVSIHTETQGLRGVIRDIDYSASWPIAVVHDGQTKMSLYNEYELRLIETHPQDNLFRQFIKNLENNS